GAVDQSADHMARLASQPRRVGRGALRGVAVMPCSFSGRGAPEDSPVMGKCNLRDPKRSIHIRVAGKDLCRASITGRRGLRFDRMTLYRQRGGVVLAKSEKTAKPEQSPCFSKPRPATVRKVLWKRRKADDAEREMKP